MRHDRACGSLDRHAAYIVAAYIDSAARQSRRKAAVPPAGPDLPGRPPPHPATAVTKRDQKANTNRRSVRTPAWCRSRQGQCRSGRSVLTCRLGGGMTSVPSASSGRAGGRAYCTCLLSARWIELVCGWLSALCRSAWGRLRSRWRRMTAEGGIMPDVGFTELAGQRVALRRFHLGDVEECGVPLV